MTAPDPALALYVRFAATRAATNPAQTRLAALGDALGLYRPPTLAEFRTWLARSPDTEDTPPP